MIDVANTATGGAAPRSVNTGITKAISIQWLRDSSAKNPPKILNHKLRGARDQPLSTNRPTNGDNTPARIIANVGPNASVAFDQPRSAFHYTINAANR